MAEETAKISFFLPTDEELFDFRASLVDFYLTLCRKLMRTLTYLAIFLFVALMLVVLAACQQQTREQIAQKLGEAMIKKVEKDVNQRIASMLKGMLENPDSYEPLSTDMAIVMNNMVLYDTQAFVALRDMRSHVKQ